MDRITILSSPPEIGHPTGAKRTSIFRRPVRVCRALAPAVTDGAGLRRRPDSSLGGQTATARRRVP